MKYPAINYFEHPAYRFNSNSLPYDNKLLTETINGVDRLHAEFSLLKSPTHADALDILSQIQKKTQIISQHVNMQGASVLAAEWLNSTLEWTVKDLSKEYVRKIFSSRDYHELVLSDANQKQVQLLQESGMYITDIPSDLYENIRRLALEYRSELRQRAISDRLNRAVTSVPFNSALWKAIKRASKSAGIIDVLSDFKKNKMTLLGVGLEYSCPEQEWYQNLYADIGLTDSPMQYLHVDEGDCLPKSMIYVTPVDIDSGPTRAVPGSNRWEKSECVFRMHKALDNVVGMRYAQFVGRGNYRLLARHAELRRVFMELPEPFQGSSHFGDDVLSGTSLATELASLEVPYLSQGGQALVFDGPQLFHRGSLVKTGERMALQVIYRNQNEEDIKAHLSQETLLTDQIALAKKYMRRFVKGYM